MGPVQRGLGFVRQQDLRPIRKHRYRENPRNAIEDVLVAKADGGQMKSMWGGRFSGKLDDAVRRVNDSLPFDCRLWREDIDGSIAYARALELAGALRADECIQI